MKIGVEKQILSMSEKYPKTSLQCSCLENPGDGRAWWAAVYGVAQSRTRLKRLSSNSSRNGGRSFLIAQLVKNPPTMQETLVQFLGWEDLLEKG